MDFETGFNIGEHIYLDEDLNENGLLDFGEDTNGNKRLDDDPTAIQRMLEDDFANYEVRFTQTRPTSGDFVTIVFNGTPDFPPNTVRFSKLDKPAKSIFATRERWATCRST